MTYDDWATTDNTPADDRCYGTCCGGEPDDPDEVMAPMCPVCREACACARCHATAPDRCVCPE